jgi:hypothetical protein
VLQRSSVSRLAILLAVPLVLASLPAASEPPPDVAYQGQLLDAQGVPKTGTVNITIGIYEAMAPLPGESALYIETHENVALDNGIFSMRIGTGTPLSGVFGPELYNATNRSTWGMQFLWPFEAEYLISYLDAGYTQTIIARNKRDLVWIMARTPTLPDADYERLVAQVKAWGYDVSALRRMPQRW